MHSSFVTEMYEQNQLPFVDLFPWAQKHVSDRPKALELLRTYLQATKPVIILSLGTNVSGIAAGSFHQQNGIKTTRMHQVLGTPILSKYGQDVLDESDDNNCVIIPCFHPGSVRQNAVRGEIGVRIIHMTLAVVWLAMDEAIVLCRDQSLSKLAICQQLVTNIVAKTGPSTEFGKAMQKLKDAYLASHVMVRQMMAPAAKAKLASRSKGKQRAEETLVEQAGDDEGDDEGDEFRSKRLGLSMQGHFVVVKAPRIRWRRGLEQLHMVCDCGMAQGDPNRPTRREQVKQLMCLSLGNLYGANSGTTAAALEKWLLNVPKHTLYFFAAQSLAEQVAETPDFISLFLEKDTDAEGDEWKADEEVCGRASSKAEAWIMECIHQAKAPFHETAKNIQRQFHLLLKESDPALASTLKGEIIQTARTDTQLFEQNGQEVQIIPSNDLRHPDTLLLRWQANGTTYNIRDLLIPSGCAPLVPGEGRYLHLIPEGLDIRDASGRSMGTGRAREIALPLHNMISNLAANPLREEFIKLWERMAGTTIDEAEFAGQGDQAAGTSGIRTGKSIPKSFFQGRSLAFQSINGSVGKVKSANYLRAEMPFQTGDAAWLVNKFVERQYPKGGTVDLANPKKFPDGPSVWKHLASFLAEPRYFNHPQRASLQAACRFAEDSTGMGKAIISKFTILMSVLRPPMTQRAVQQMVEGRNTKRQILTISDTCPAGTVVDREEPQDRDLEDTGRQQILGDSGELVEDEDGDEEDESTAIAEEMERARLAAARRRAARNEPEEDEPEDGGTYASSSVRRGSHDHFSNRPLMPAQTDYPTAIPPFARQYQAAASAAAQRQSTHQGYEGFRPDDVPETGYSSTKRAREDEGTDTGTAKKARAEKSSKSTEDDEQQDDDAERKQQDDDAEMLLD